MKTYAWEDWVDIDQYSTRICTRHNLLVIIPNNTIRTGQIVRYSYPDPRDRIERTRDQL